jgi:rare lipoprotein A
VADFERAGGVREGTSRMRHIVVFCAIAFGTGCDASAAELGLASFSSLAGGLTAAHRSLPMGSQVRVLDLDNGRSVVVRIVDRGPFIHGRVIDVSTAVAVALGFRDAGLAHVKIDPISPNSPQTRSRRSQQSASPPDETTPYAICRYGAARLERLQGDSLVEEAAWLSRDGLGCDNFRLRLFRLAQSTDDVAPVFSRTKIHLAGVEAAASIPVGALAEIEAAASIPVTALAAVPKHEAPRARTERGCRGPGSCEKRAPPSASNPVLVLFARLRHIFD